MADNETGFLIDCDRYELPDMGTFTIRESRVFYRETGLVPEVVRMRLQAGDLTFMDLLENVGFLPALATVAYMREHDDADDATVEAVIAATRRDDLFMALLDQGDDAVPPSEGVTSTPPELSQNGSSESTPSIVPLKSSSGRTSTPSSVRQEDLADSIGTTELDTWATLDRETSAI